MGGNVKIHDHSALMFNSNCSRTSFEKSHQIWGSLFKLLSSLPAFKVYEGLKLSPSPFPSLKRV